MMIMIMAAWGKVKLGLAAGSFPNVVRDNQLIDEIENK